LALVGSSVSLASNSLGATKSFEAIIEDGPALELSRALWVGSWAAADPVERTILSDREGAFFSFFGGVVWNQKNVSTDFYINNEGKHYKYETSVEAKSTKASGALVGKTWSWNAFAPWSLSVAAGGGRSSSKWGNPTLFLEGAKETIVDCLNSLPKKGLDPTAIAMDLRQTYAIAATNLRKTWESRKALRRSLSIDLVGQMGDLALRPKVGPVEDATPEDGDSSSSSSISLSFLSHLPSFHFPCSLARCTLDGEMDLCQLSGFHFGPFCSLSVDRFAMNFGLPLLNVGLSYYRGDVRPGLQCWLLNSNSRFRMNCRIGCHLSVCEGVKLSDAILDVISYFDPSLQLNGSASGGEGERDRFVDFSKAKKWRSATELSLSFQKNLRGKWLLDGSLGGIFGSDHSGAGGTVTLTYDF
jgi:hypothetical protein